MILVVVWIWVVLVCVLFLLLVAVQTFRAVRELSAQTALLNLKVTTMSEVVEALDTDLRTVVKTEESS